MRPEISCSGTHKKTTRTQQPIAFAVRCWVFVFFFFRWCACCYFTFGALARTFDATKERRVTHTHTNTLALRTQQEKKDTKAHTFTQHYYLRVRCCRSVEAQRCFQRRVAEASREPSSQSHMRVCALWLAAGFLLFFFGTFCPLLAKSNPPSDLEHALTPRELTRTSPSPH